MMKQIGNAAREPTELIWNQRSCTCKTEDISQVGESDGPDKSRGNDDDGLDGVTDPIKLVVRKDNLLNSTTEGEMNNGVVEEDSEYKEAPYDLENKIRRDNYLLCRRFRKEGQQVRFLHV